MQTRSCPCLGILVSARTFKNSLTNSYQKKPRVDLRTAGKKSSLHLAQPVLSKKRSDSQESDKHISLSRSHLWSVKHSEQGRSQERNMGSGGDNLRVVAMLLPAFLLMGLETLLTVHVDRLLLSFASTIMFPSLTMGAKAILTARVDVAVCVWQLVNYLISPVVCYLKESVLHSYGVHLHKLLILI